MLSGTLDLGEYIVACIIEYRLRNINTTYRQIDLVFVFLCFLGLSHSWYIVECSESVVLYEFSVFVYIENCSGLLENCTGSSLKTKFLLQFS